MHSWRGAGRLRERGRERDGAEIRDRFVPGVSKVTVATKKRRGHFSMSLPFDTVNTYTELEKTGYVNDCFPDDKLRIWDLI